MTDGEALALRGVAKRFGPRGTQALRGVDLDVKEGEFVALVGPSGCGKSTLLRIIAGFESCDEGIVAIAGRNVSRVAPEDRDLAMVFQNFALYPHMTVADNIAMPMAMRRLSLAARLPGLRRILPHARRGWTEIQRDVGAIAAQLQIRELLDRLPGELSGGQKQRVALGRAIARRPRVFLMDEPLSSLDATLRIELRAELTELQRSLGITCLYVTHDQAEAMTMADRIAVMMEGRVVQAGAPAEIYAEPQHVSVARFLGSPSINLLAATIEAEGQLSVLGQALPLAVTEHTASGFQAGIRAENLVVRRLGRGPSPGVEIMSRLQRVEHIGHELLLHLVAEVGTSKVGLVARTPVAGSWSQGDEVSVGFDPEALFVFAADGARVATRLSEGSALKSRLAAAG